ncbi:MAG: molecular chaperone DnaJ [Planctomycetes bacterium]|nr:molecular chaperone DnaJ [Planctomycetota bacterium]
MPKDIVTSATPEEREIEKKQQELKSLETDLVQSELQLATLQAELRAFQARYFHALGARFVELDSIEAEIAERQARRHPADAAARERAEQARERSQHATEETEAFRGVPDRGKFTPTEDLKRLYRGIALRVHPDRADGDSDRERRHRVMAEVNEAYANGDETRLRALLKEWEASPEAIVGDEPAARLVRLIRQLSQIWDRLVAIRAEVQRIKASEPFQLQSRVEEAEAAGRDLLAEMAEHLDEQIREARKRLGEVEAAEGRK